MAAALIHLFDLTRRSLGGRPGMVAPSEALAALGVSRRDAADALRGPMAASPRRRPCAGRPTAGLHVLQAR